MLLFVYGSLKEGFPNFHVNRGRRVPGEFRTVQPYPLYLADGTLPCLLLLPGEGLQVAGQLFEVDAAELAAMDELERLGQPGGYARLTIEVEPWQAGAAGAAATSGVVGKTGKTGMTGITGTTRSGRPADRIEAFVYVQGEARLAPGGAHTGPLAEYTIEHARTLRW